MIRKVLSLFFVYLIFGLIQLNGQSVNGIVRDFDDDHKIQGVLIQVNNATVETDVNGKFSIKIPASSVVEINFSKSGYINLKKVFNSETGDYELGTVIISAVNSESIDNYNIDLDDIDADGESEDNTYSILSASRDLFGNTAAYSFGVARFRARGYGSEYAGISLNGAPINNLNDGQAYWSVWGGLNDVFRVRNNVGNVGSNEFSFGNIGGSSNIDLRASSQRKQIKASYAISNRSYRNRIMVTASTGMMSNGWAITASGSLRWSDEGYIESTFYDAQSYFLSIDKQLSKNHLLNLVILGAPIQRGKRGASTQEANDLAGSNFYNSNWGYQNGEKRNARYVKAHQPIGILRHDWNISNKSILSSSAVIQLGTYGSSRLEWTNAPDPRADYYRNLPSYQLTESAKEEVANYFKEDPTRLQLDWDKFYLSNHFSNPTTIDNVNGIDGASVTGRNAIYALAETHYDNHKFSFQSHLNTELSQNSKLDIGVYFRHETVKNYQKLVDLLGADYYLDIDKFALRDNAGDNNFYQSDLNNPNRVAYVDDKIRYNYDIVTMRPGIWGQYEVNLKKFDIYLGADLSTSNFFRRGHMKNGKFPDSSFGDSEKQNFLNYGAKFGVTYKMNGRNYFILNSAYTSNGIGGRYAYSSPRTRDHLIKTLDNETVKTVDLSYHARYTGFKLKASVYFTRFENQNYNRSFYLDQSSNSAFINYIMTGINKEHKGVELAIEKSIGAGFSIRGVAAIGDYRYKSRPDINITFDSSPLSDNSNWVGYLNNYMVPNTPQIAYNATLAYSKNYWFANVSFNYFDKMYIDFYPHRRTEEYVNGVNKLESPELWNDIIGQEKLPSNYTIDVFAGKSWKVNDYYVNLNVGVNNVLNNTSFRTGGYEQTRFDVVGKNVDKFPPKYFYAYGTNYYISLGIRI